MTVKFTKKELVCVIGIAVFTLLFLAFLLLFPDLAGGLEGDIRELSEIAVSRFLGGAVFLFLMVYLDYPLLSPRRLPSAKALLVSLPALVIAVNNFPILGLIGGSVWVDSDPVTAVLLVLACLGIGFFEETAFRGVIFPVLLSRLLTYTRKRAKPNAKLSPETLAVLLAIVLTSAVFGLVHALNLFSGGNPVSVLMQVGYSFLIGGMCAIVLLKTRCLWFPVAIHAIYDCGGMLIRYLGGGKLWDTPTVVLTVIVSVAVALFFLTVLFRVKREEIEDCLSERHK